MTQKSPFKLDKMKNLTYKEASEAYLFQLYIPNLLPITL